MSHTCEIWTTFCSSFGNRFTALSLSKYYFHILDHCEYIFPVRLWGFFRWSGLPLKYFPFFLTWWFKGRNRQWPRYMTFRHLFKYILSRSSKQCVHALYPLFVWPKRLLKAGQSLIVTNNIAHRSKCSCLYSSQTHTPGLFHKTRSSSTNGSR